MSLKITWLSHSAFRLDIGKAVVLIDPFLSGNPTFKGNVDDVTKGVTHILLTHGHDDHTGDAAGIAKKTGAQIVSNFEICSAMAEQGAQNINPGNTGGTVDCGGFTVSFTQAHHSSGTVRDGKSIYLGNPNGLVIKHPDAPVIFHMGDTDIFSDMALIDEIHQPKIGFVPVGDRFTMGGAVAAMALKRFFHLDVAVPCHYATFPLLTPDASAFAKAMEGHKTKVIVPEQGVAFSV